MTNTQKQNDRRVVVLDGSINFRDLGGYVNRQGQKVVWEHIYRAAGLSNLSTADQALLAKRRIRYDIDLRSPSEQTTQPDRRWQDVQLISNPIYPVTDSERVFNRLQRHWPFHHHTQPKLTNPIARIYQNVILNAYSQKAFAKIFKILLAQKADQATVFHCAAGKDRTGMTAALILSALDVPEKTIIQDYLLTNDLYDFTYQAQAPTADQIQQAVAKMNTQSGEALYIQGVLQTIDEGYGGFTHYWQEALGFSKQDLLDFRKLYLQSSAN